MNHVFVDFENVPKVDLAALGTQEAHVTLLIGEKQRRLELGLVRQIHEYATKLTLIEVGTSGRNALDLVLAWHLGRTAERHPGDPFFVVSGDRDFDPLIRHLRARGLTVERVNEFCALPFLVPRGAARKPPRARRAPQAPAPAPAPAPVPPARASPPPRMSADDRLAKLIDRLQHKTKARPVRRKTLLSHIGQFYGGQLAEPEVEQIVTTLEERGIITIDPRGRVSYADAT